MLSYDVRRLNAPQAIDTLKHYIQGLKLSLDFLFLQENKLRQKTATKLHKQLQVRSTYWCLDATVGCTGDDNKAGKGGVATFIAPK